MNNIEAFEVMRRDKLEELLDEYFDLAVEKGRNFERNGLRSNQVRKEILSLFDLASQEQQTESKLVAWGYAWECKSVGDWRIEKLGEGCIPPKDTLALYTAPEGDKP